MSLPRTPGLAPGSLVPWGRCATGWQILGKIGVTIILGAGILFLTPPFDSQSPRPRSIMKMLLLCPARLLVLGATLGVSVLGGCCGFATHSLSYFYLRVSEPSQGPPQSWVRGYLDDQPITQFNSLTGRVEPLVSWMEKVERETFLPSEWVFETDLVKASKLNDQTEGLHTWQAIMGCTLRENGSKDGFLRYGYDGMDFLSFDKETLRWVAAQPQAEKVKEEWEEYSGWSLVNKDYLEETCIIWLKRYLSRRKEALEKAEPPIGKVTRKVVDDSLEVLICQAFGFYPKEIQATWRRDGEVSTYKTSHQNVAPSFDGTHYVWLSIEIDSKERDRFQCHLEHEGLQKPLVLVWEEEIAWWTHVGIGATTIWAVGTLFLIWRCPLDLFARRAAYFERERETQDKMNRALVSGK